MLKKKVSSLYAVLVLAQEVGCDAMISDGVRFVQEANHKTAQDETKLRQRIRIRIMVLSTIYRYYIQSQD